VEVDVDVDVEPLSLSCSSNSRSSFLFDDSPAKSFSPFVGEDGVVVLDEDVVLAEASVVEGCDVIWARPTPAAAAKASPTITPTSERRLNRLSRLSMPKSRPAGPKLAPCFEGDRSVQGVRSTRER
jgi:hypothetical protein